MVIELKIMSFLNKIIGVFYEGRSFYSKGFKFDNKKTGKGMSGGTNSTYYRFEGNVFLVNFWLTIDPGGFWVMRNKLLLNVWVKGGRFNGFSDKASNGIQRVFSERFVGGRRKNVLKSDRSAFDHLLIHP
jgi:hypothetical protein